MSKIIATINSKQFNLELLDYIDAVIIGVNGYTVNLPFNYDANEIENVISFFNSKNKEVFILLNKNFRNIDIENLKELLIKLDKLGIKGIIYYDIAIVNLKEKLDLKVDLVWGQEHMTTNYYTINYWYEHGAKYTLLSSEITLDEILKIKNNCEAKLIVQVFGYVSIFNSFRHVVNNYKKMFHLNDNSMINYIEKENKIYPIIDNTDGSVIYSNYIMNALHESIIMDENNVDYLFLNSFNIDSDKYVEVCKLFKEVNKDNVDEYNSKLKDMFSNLEKGFLYKETIYKVKE